MTERGWVKNYRNIVKWEWYTAPNMAHLFQHLIRQANHKPTKWRGEKIDRGQILTGRKQLSAETGISEQSIRTCLERLKSTNEITIKSTKQYSIITICNYKKYQADERASNQESNHQSSQQLTNNQPTTNQQLTTSNNDKNDKNDKNVCTHNSKPIFKGQESKDFDRSGNPKRAIKASEYIYLSEPQIEAFKKNYKDSGFDDLDIKGALDILDAYATNHSKKFNKYISHYKVLIGWVKEEIKKRRKVEIDLIRSDTYLQNVKGGR